MTPPQKQELDRRERGALPAPEGGVRAPASGGAADDSPPDDLLGGMRMYALLVTSVLDYAIFALDTTGRIVSWNEGARRIKGYLPEEIIGHHFSEFYPEEDLARGKPAWELEVAERDGRLEDEGWRVRKDGTRFWANVIITALRDPQGRLVGFAKVTRDLSERRRAEEALRASEERFRLLVQSVRDYAIFLLDPAGRVATWNEGAERIKGYGSDEIVGRHFSVFYPEEDLARGKPALELEVAQRDGRFEEEGWRVRKDGTRFWASVVVTALYDPTGALVGYAKVTRDLTERRAAEERALADARRIASIEAANAAKSEFLATMSHELRTPLNAIGGYADLMEIGVGGPISGQHKEYLQRIRQSQQHLLGIINDLLNYSRIEAGQVEYERKPVPIHRLAQRGLEMLTPQAVQKRIALVHGDCDAGAVAIADPARAEQVLLNLLSNAVKFTPPGGRVTVVCERDGERVMVTIRDNGPGIPPEKLEAIFEPFVQLGRGLKNLVEGTGLGLAISRDLARGMGGDLTATSEPGVGSAFTFALPLAPGASDA
jgi:PAS domain S-box-containing protein